MDQLIELEEIAKCIYSIRGIKVMLDHDLAEFYGVPTKRLNEQIKRNRGRFPKDFVFQLTKDEREKVVANCDHLVNLKYSPSLPYVFTEHGAIMAASVLNSQRAIEVSVLIVRAFVQLRHLVINNPDLKRELDEFRNLTEERFKVLFTVLDQLVTDDGASTRKIGFIETKQ